MMLIEEVQANFDVSVRMIDPAALGLGREVTERAGGLLDILIASTTAKRG